MSGTITRLAQYTTQIRVVEIKHTISRLKSIGIIVIHNIINSKSAQQKTEKKETKQRRLQQQQQKTNIM